MNLYGYEFQRDSDLAHYGILGMRWGVRRYQNKDGTLTAEGKKRAEVRSHNQTLSYRVGEKRINKRISNLEKDARRDAASIFKTDQARIANTEMLRKANQAILDNPLRTSDVGKRTIRGRIWSTSMSSLAGLGLGAYLTSVTGSVAAMPLASIPIALIGSALYWIPSTE